MQTFMKELSNYIENNMTNNTKLSDISNNWNNLLSEDLMIHNEKIITKYRDEMIKERNDILQNYAQDTKEEGEMYYIYDITNNETNSYNLCICEESKSHQVITKSIGELPEGIHLGSVLRKQGEDFMLDIEATKAMEEKINNMIEEKIKEQNLYLDSKRIDGHVYEVGEKYSGRIWLYDVNRVDNGEMEGIEEIEFPKELYETAKEGDLFVYKNGEYQMQSQS